jgi:hypothetical protein
MASCSSLSSVIIERGPWILITKALNIDLQGLTPATPFNPSGTARIAPVQTAYKPSAVLSMSFHSIAVQNAFLSHNRRIPIGWLDPRNLTFSPASRKTTIQKRPHSKGGNVEMRHLTNKTEFRADILKERGQLARRSLRRRLGLAHSYKVNSSAPSALLGDILARHSPQDGGGCAFDPARRQSPFRGTARSLLIQRRPTPFNPSGTARIVPVQPPYKPSAVFSMSFHSIAVQNSFLSHNRRIPNGWADLRNSTFSKASP